MNLIKLTLVSSLFALPALATDLYIEKMPQPILHEVHTILQNDPVSTSGNCTDWKSDSSVTCTLENGSSGYRWTRQCESYWDNQAFCSIDNSSPANLSMMCSDWTIDNSVDCNKQGSGKNQYFRDCQDIRYMVTYCGNL